MTPSAWIALASLGVALVLQSIVLSFMLGRLFQRVATVEKESGGVAILTNTIARMEAHLENVKESVDDLKRAWSADAPAPRRVRKASE